MSWRRFMVLIGALSHRDDSAFFNWLQGKRKEQRGLITDPNEAHNVIQMWSR